MDEMVVLSLFVSHYLSMHMNVFHLPMVIMRCRNAWSIQNTLEAFEVNDSKCLKDCFVYIGRFQRQQYFFLSISSNTVVALYGQNCVYIARK